MIKQYKVDWNGFEVVIAIDHNKADDKRLHEINDFWSDAEWRLSDADGDIGLTVAKLLAAHCLWLQASQNLNPYGVMKAFDWGDGEGQEGWPRMDGWCGIVIVHCDEVSFDSDGMDAVVEPLAALPSPPPEPKW